MSCKKCSNKFEVNFIRVYNSVLHFNFLCFVVHIELVSYLNHSRNTFASLHVNYMFLHTLDLNRPSPLPLFIYYRRQVCLLNAFQILIQTLQLQRFITCLIITKYDLKFIAICHQLIVAQWLALLATNLKVSGSRLTWRFSR
jgi:hypothetical protein